MTDSEPNYRAPLDAGTAFCYISGVIDPARVSAGRWAAAQNGWRTGTAGCFTLISMNMSGYGQALRRATLGITLFCGLMILTCSSCSPTGKNALLGLWAEQQHGSNRWDVVEFREDGTFLGHQHFGTFPMTYKWLDDNHIEFQSELVGTNAKTVHLTELYGVAAEGNSLTLSNLNVGAPVPVDRFQRISRRGLSHFKVSPSVRRHYTTTQMNLVNYNEFAKLRLYQFEPTARRWEAGENDDADWEFMNSLWFDQDSVHFHVEFLRHQDEPDRVGAVCLYLNCQRPDLVARVLEAIHLPLRRGMTLSEVGSVLGAPIETEMPTARFLCGSPDQYLVSCRFEDGDCLNKVSIIRKDLLADEDSNA